MIAVPGYRTPDAVRPSAVSWWCRHGIHRWRYWSAETDCAGGTMWWYEHRRCSRSGCGRHERAYNSVIQESDGDVGAWEVVAC